MKKNTLLNKATKLFNPKYWFIGFVSLLSLSFAMSAFAQDAVTIGTVAKTVTASFGNLAKLITAGAYIAGLGFAVGSVLKFKQHKDNPTQIPIGTPVALLFVAAALIFLPNIFGITGATLFGQQASVGGPSGVIFCGANSSDCDTNTN